MIKAANTVPAVSGSTLIVLGCRVKGEQPSLMLQNRINAAYAYLSENPDADAILSGGQGSDELISEAECMYRELVDMGIAPERLVKEDKSSNTHENLQNSLALTENDNIVIVTSEFHQYRAKLIAQKEGTEVSAISAKTSLFLLPTYWVRDCLGCAYELVSK
ncbi:MAG: YdcF family protein [Oscillospiraceae bacterium]|nr:YdcF family protein [Oscillospiraceae bacterium]